MKSIFLAIIALLSLNGYSQSPSQTISTDNDIVIYLKDGTKIVPEKSDVRNNTEDNEIVYWREGVGEKYVKYKDLDYITAGDKLFKNFELKEKGETRKQKPHPRFVAIETPKYRLLTAEYSYSMSVQMMIIIDKDDVVLESKMCIFGGTKKDKKTAKETAEIIRKYFSDIKEEMDLLDQCQLNEKDGETSGLREFLRNHSYKKYE